MPFDVSPRSSCLFLDVDGSLIDIASHPDDVHVPPTLVRDLTRASDLLDGAVALVSGRSLTQLDRLFAPARLRASGVHGAQWRREPGGSIETPAAGAIPRSVWQAVESVVAAFPGTFAEDKAFSFAVHYRAAPDVAERLAAALRRIVEADPAGLLRLLPGHYVFEIKGADFDKGMAVRRFMAGAPFAGREPIFIGDDITDLPGFTAAMEAGGRAYAVGADIPGTSGTFASPSAVRQWLASLATMEHVNA